jgi:hypothetical protein
VLFSEDFESGLGQWEVSHPDAMTIVDSSDPKHGRIFEMRPEAAQQAALMRASESWRGVRIEGQVLFPTDEHNYLGFIYNLQQHGDRVHLGGVYIKGNGSYVRVNPRRDWNPARSLYEEYRVPLEGNDAIQVGQWQRFAAEVVGNVCHFYVGDLVTPKLTFDLFELDHGKFGFKPRVVGGAVWLDDLIVVAISEFSYHGPALPANDYRLRGLVTEWQVLGPLTRAFPDIETLPDPTTRDVTEQGEQQTWRRFETDRRGAVVTGRVVDFIGSRTVAYFATTIRVGDGERASLDVSSIDDIALWHNGEFLGYSYRERFAWHDFGVNPDRVAARDRLSLPPGDNHILLRVRGGVYASGGFYARVFPDNK